MLKFNVDDHEYAYLRLICLFSVDHLMINQNKRNHIERIQEQSFKCLKNYIEKKNYTTAGSTQTTNTTECNNDGSTSGGGNNDNNFILTERFPKLLLKLPMLRALEPKIVEDLFFTNLIGQVHIEIVIPYILRLSGTGNVGDGVSVFVSESNF